ncbi:hypothetical protein ACA910_014354 [Epithemia clementina (nom. ined.)]
MTQAITTQQQEDHNMFAEIVETNDEETELLNITMAPTDELQADSTEQPLEVPDSLLKDDENDLEYDDENNDFLLQGVVTVAVAAEAAAATEAQEGNMTTFVQTTSMQPKGESSDQPNSSSDLPPALDTPTTTNSSDDHKEPEAVEEEVDNDQALDDKDEPDQLSMKESKGLDDEPSEAEQKQGGCEGFGDVDELAHEQLESNDPRALESLAESTITSLEKETTQEEKAVAATAGTEPGSMAPSDKEDNSARLQQFGDNKAVEQTPVAAEKEEDDDDDNYKQEKVENEGESVFHSTVQGGGSEFDKDKDDSESEVEEDVFHSTVQGAFEGGSSSTTQPLVDENHEESVTVDKNKESVAYGDSEESEEAAAEESAIPGSTSDAVMEEAIGEHDKVSEANIENYDDEEETEKETETEPLEVNAVPDDKLADGDGEETEKETETEPLEVNAVPDEKVADDFFEEDQVAEAQNNEETEVAVATDTIDPPAIEAFGEPAKQGEENDDKTGDGEDEQAAVLQDESGINSGKESAPVATKEGKAIVAIDETPVHEQAADLENESQQVKEVVTSIVDEAKPGKVDEEAVDVHTPAVDEGAPVTEKEETTSAEITEIFDVEQGEEDVEEETATDAPTSDEKGKDDKPSTELLDIKQRAFEDSARMDEDDDEQAAADERLTNADTDFSGGKSPEPEKEESNVVAEQQAIGTYLTYLGGNKGREEPETKENQEETAVVAEESKKEPEEPNEVEEQTDRNGTINKETSGLVMVIAFNVSSGLPRVEASYTKSLEFSQKEEQQPPAALTAAPVWLESVAPEEQPEAAEASDVKDKAVMMAPPETTKAAEAPSATETNDDAIRELLPKPSDEIWKDIQSHDDDDEPGTGADGEGVAEEEQQDQQEQQQVEITNNNRQTESAPQPPPKHPNGMQVDTAPFTPRAGNNNNNNSHDDNFPPPSTRSMATLFPGSPGGATAVDDEELEEPEETTTTTYNNNNNNNDQAAQVVEGGDCAVECAPSSPSPANNNTTTALALTPAQEAKIQKSAGCCASSTPQAFETTANDDDDDVAEPPALSAEEDARIQDTAACCVIF